MNRFREPSTSTGGVSSPATLDITSPGNAKNSRSEGDERFRNLVESSLQGVVVHRNDRPLFANQAAAEILGYDSPDDILQMKTIDECVAPHERQRMKTYREARARGEEAPEHYEFQVLRKDGTTSWTEVRPTIVDWDGKPAIQAVCNDITKRKQTEEALQRSEEQFRDFAETASDWFWETDAEHRFTDVSQHEDPVVNAFNQSGIGKTRFELRLADDRDDEKWGLHQADLAAHRPFRNFEYSREAEEGAKRYMRVSGRPIYDDEGTFVGYRGTASDVTDRKMAELALLESEQRFKDIANTASDWFWETDAEHRFTGFSGESDSQVDYWSRVQAGKTRFDARIAEDTDDAKWEAHRADLDAHRPFKNFQYPARGADGAIHHVRISGKPIFSSDGGFRGYRGAASDITDFVEAEERARSAQQQLAAAIDGFPAAIVLFDADDRLVVANRAWREFNQAVADVTHPGTPWKDYMRGLMEAGLFPEARGREEDWLQERLKKRRNPSGPYVIARGDGNWTRINDHRLPDGGLLTVATDISDLKRAQRGLEESEERFKDFAESAGDWFWETDSQHRFTGFSGEDSMVSNNPVRRAIGKTRSDMRIADDDDDENWQAHRATLDAHEPFRNFLFPFADDDGVTNYVRASGRPVFSDDGEFLGYRGSSANVTAEVEAEERARSARARLAAAIEGFSEIVVLWDAEDRLAVANRRWRDYNKDITEATGLGTRYEDYVRSLAASGVYPDAVADPEAWVRKTLEGHRNPTKPSELARSDGRWFLVNKQRLPDGATITFATDITDRKRAENEIVALNEELEKRVEERTRDLADKTALLEATFESISEGFALFDREDRLVYCNETFMRKAGPVRFILKPGVSFEDIVRTNISKSWVNYGGEDVEAKVQARLAQHRNPEGDHEVQMGDGRWLLMSERKTADGGTALVLADIDNLKQREQELTLAKEEADDANRAKSEFLSRMSHELRTPMNAILGFGQILQADPEEPLGPNQSVAVEEILKGGNHLLELINEVLDLAGVESRNVTLTIEVIDPGSIIESCLSLAEPLAEERRIDLVNKAAGKDLARVSADETRFRQALLNLVSNAVKYNRDGGAVTVDANETDDGMVRVGVADTGPGIAIEKQDQLFEPFNRLGAKDGMVEGTGIGLTITKQLVELMGGRIGFESSLGKGSVFWIELPVATRPT